MAGCLTPWERFQVELALLEECDFRSLTLMKPCLCLLGGYALAEVTGYTGRSKQ